MPKFFDPTPEERKALEDIAHQIPDVQRTLVRNHPRLTVPDRGAHQMQLAGTKVLLTIADALPPELDGLGIFQRSSPARIGIGRMSTGLGCPHAETNADFLGLMVAFRTAEGRRIDFVTINDPTSPTDTPEEFLALLKATADAASTEDQLASQARLLAGLARHARLRAPAIALHVTAQTFRTVRSSSASPTHATASPGPLGTGCSATASVVPGGVCCSAAGPVRASPPPTTTTSSRSPSPASRSRPYVTSGRLSKGTSDFGRSGVIGRSRVPMPPVSNTPSGWRSAITILRYQPGPWRAQVYRWLPAAATARLRRWVGRGKMGR